jgi:hypothetical protein
VSLVAPADAEAVRNLTARFHYLIDHGQASDCLALCAPNAKFVFGPGSPNPGTIEGLDAIGVFLKARQAAPIKTRHNLGLSLLRPRGADTIVVSTLLTLYRSPGETPLVPAALADLDETYVRTDQGWRLLVREVRPVDWS